LYTVDILQEATLEPLRSNQVLLEEGKPYPLLARTMPSGFEAFVQWSAVTKHGKAVPERGRGPRFTVRFYDTVGEDGIQWLGVQADNAIFNQDQKRGSLCSVDPFHFRGSHFSELGEVLADTFLVGSIPAKFQQAASTWQGVIDYLDSLAAEGVSPNPGARDSVELMRDDLSSIATFVGQEAYASAYSRFRRFRETFAQYAIDPNLFDIDSALVVPFRNAVQTLEISEAALYGLAHPEEFIDHYLDLDTLLAMDPDTLEAAADSLLAIDDPTAVDYLGLADPEVRNSLENITALQSDPDVIAWIQALHANPDSVHKEMMSAALDNALIATGNHLLGGGAELVEIPAVPFLGLWADDCTPVCSTRSCALKGITVTNWRSNANILVGKDLTLTLLKFVPLGGRAPLKGVVVKAVKALQKILLEKDELGTRIWIKVGWQHCEVTWCCWPLVENNEWIDKESKWLEVPIPAGRPCWPKGSDWKDPAIMTSILTAIGAKTAAVCGGPLPPC
jgi:hypothetical protein